MSLAILFQFLCNKDTTQTQPHQIANTQRTENKMTDVVIQQHSRNVMDKLMSETCWVHKKWNKIASDIKFVFHSSTTRFVFMQTRFALLFCMLLYQYGAVHSCTNKNWV